MKRGTFDHAKRSWATPRPSGAPLQASKRYRTAARFHWHSTRDLLENGRIGIFNRSSAEEVRRYAARNCDQFARTSRNDSFTRSSYEGRRFTIPEPGGARDEISAMLTAAILDVDGVLLASPHERAWREALQGFADPERFTTAIYQAAVAGKPRLSGAVAGLEALGVPDAAKLAPAYAAKKQKRLVELIHAGGIEAFPDALRFVQAVRSLGWPMAVASSSKNANAMMQKIQVDSGRSLLDMFSVNVCGRDLAHGKPDPEIFLLAARELGIEPAQCLVVEDAPAGIEAARAGRMTGLGVARNEDAAGLRAAGAELVVTSLDEVAMDALAGGRLCQ